MRLRPPRGGPDLVWIITSSYNTKENDFPFTGNHYVANTPEGGGSSWSPYCPFLFYPRFFHCPQGI